MAVGALAHFQEAGINVPGDVSVLGYDDTHTAQFTAPRLSSVHMPWTDITLNGLNCLLNSCYGMNRPFTHETQVSVTERASVAKVKARRSTAA